MKRLALFIGTFSLLAHAGAQILTSDPEFPTAFDDITVYYNVASGNAEIPTGTIPVYAHTAVLSQQDEDNCVNNWQYTQGNWGTADPDVVMTPMGGGIHKMVINPQTFYNYPGNVIPANLNIGRLMFVFRNQGGTVVGRNANGSDIFLEIYDDSFHAGILQPYEQIIVASTNEVIPIHSASSDPADLTLLVDGNVVATATNATSLDYDFSSAVNGGFNVELIADNGTQQINETILININPQPAVLASPSGTIDGINYVDASTVRLQIYAPNKDFIYVLGDFNDWQFNADYLMNRTPDGNTYWLDLNNLDPNVPHLFQYSIDAVDLRIADPYSEMILDPWNDSYIPASTYPNIPAYPSCSTSQAVSVIKLNEPTFNWTDAAYFRPPAERLVIYELHLRDFLDTKNYQTLQDTLDYLDNLGITAIELMPINEFEGNDSWGYNPSFYFAQDKAYGTKEALQSLINECHNRGMAVIQDIALNHSFGQSPMVRMYFNPDAGQYGQPTAENPWYNEVPKHDFNVGYDFNHESPRTREFCKRVLAYWLEEYHMDGFRFDLSKGFTQNNTLGDIGAWNAYDQSRVNILNDYYTHIQNTEPGAYLVLEHLSDNSEEIALADDGMMLWGNLASRYEQASMGYSTDSDLNWGCYTNRGWSNPRLVTYAESHDEERMMYKNLNFGNSNGGYNIHNLNTALDRQELAHTFLIPVPGPKMMWQFGELGYDYSINYCTESGTINTDCRTYAKPVRWDYRDVAERYKVYKVISALNNLKKTEALFSTTNFDVDMAGMGKRIHLNSGPLNATIVGNFNVTTISMTPGFQHTGTWYDYFTGTSFEENNLSNAFSYQPGEYHIYFDQPMATPDTSVNVSEAMNLFGLDFMVYPNPATDRVTIGFNNTNSGLVNIDLLDITGAVVERIESRNMGAGLQTVEWNTTPVSRGMYFVRVSSGDSVVTRPLILGER